MHVGNGDMPSLDISDDDIGSMEDEACCGDEEGQSRRSFFSAEYLNEAGYGEVPIVGGFYAAVAMAKAWWRLN